MTLKSNSEELALIAREIGAEVIQERLQQGRKDKNRLISDVEECLGNPGD